MRKPIIALLLMLSAMGFLWGQFSIASASTPYTQDFNTLANTGTSNAWANGTTLTGWYAKTDATATISTYGANTGSSTSAGLYSFGSTSATDRALGYAPSNAYFGAAGVGKGYLGWRLVNNTGSAITSLTVTWTGEQWRKENNANAHTLNLTYQVGATVSDLTAGTWSSASSVFTSPIIGATTAAVLDGNLAANRVVGIVATINAINIPAGDEIMIRWEDLNDSGNDHFLAIDDVSVVATGGAPAPSIDTTGTLSAFSTVVGTPSASQSYTLSGTNLTANINVAALTGFEYSTDNSTWSSTLSVANTFDGLIYVRLSGSTVGSYSGNIVHSSTGASDVNVAASGTVSPPPPPNAPVAIDATAISHEGFTARWNAVAGSTSYRIDVYKGGATYATDLIISEYIEGSSNNKAIEIYNGTGESVDLSQYYVRKQTNGAGAWGGNINLSGSLSHGQVYVIAHASASSTILALANRTVSTTPMDFNGNDCIGLFKGTTSEDAVQIDQVGILNQVSPDWGANVTLVRKASITAPTVDYNVSDWNSYASDTTTYLGSHTMGSAPTIVAGWSNKAVNSTVVRVSGLDQSTNYLYLVRAVNDNGTSSNSNTIEVSTLAEDIGTGASTTISGAPFTIKVLPLEGFTNNSVDIDPSSTTSDDIYMIVTLYSNSIKYSFTGNNAALNGLYWINHAGLGYIPFDVTVNDGTIVEWMSDANETFVEISDFGAKGTLEITLHEEDTLPVELSSFSAVINAYNKVNLLWVTQTETNLTGFYVYRSDNADIASALQISPLISPTNTSTQQQYIYTDGSLTEDGMYYYWLQVAEMDGSNSLHGPTTVNFSGQSGPGTPSIPLVTEISNIYPNPFNPATTISYSLAATADVSFTIYNSRGQVVRSFDKGIQTANTYKLSWNGKDNYGKECSTGVYFVRMNAGKDSFVRKAVLMK